MRYPHFVLFIFALLLPDLPQFNEVVTVAIWFLSIFTRYGRVCVPSLSSVSREVSVLLSSMRRYALTHPPLHGTKRGNIFASMDSSTSDVTALPTCRLAVSLLPLSAAPYFTAVRIPHAHRTPPFRPFSRSCDRFGHDTKIARSPNFLPCIQMSAMGLPLRLPTDAHHTLYVEGVPGDASERELAHIFRPFPGYISLRLRAKGGRSLGSGLPSNADAICFVEFESPYHVSRTFKRSEVEIFRVLRCFVCLMSPFASVSGVLLRNADRHEAVFVPNSVTCMMLAYGALFAPVGVVQ